MAKSLDYPDKIFILTYVEAWAEDYDEYYIYPDVYVDFYDAAQKLQEEARSRGMGNITVDYNLQSASAFFEPFDDSPTKQLAVRARMLIPPQRQKSDNPIANAEMMFSHVGGFVSAPIEISADCVIWDDPKEVYKSIARALSLAPENIRADADGFPTMDVDMINPYKCKQCQDKGIVPVVTLEGETDYIPYCSKCGKNV